MNQKQAVDQMIEKCLERDEQAYEKLRLEFRERVANLNAVPDVSRIQELERIWGELNETRKSTTSDAIMALIKDINEAQVIDLKKENMQKEG